MLVFMCLPGLLFAQTDKRQAIIDSINHTFTYRTGTVDLNDGMARLTVPAGFKYLDPTQSKRLLVDIWGNPEAGPTQGMIFPTGGDAVGKNAWAFVVTYDEMGYVSDKDADEIDYDDLLTTMQAETDEENKARVEQGYDPVTLVGWASTPFYDKDHKILHWAKELKFGDTTSVNTVNYDVRILGRKGVISLNAVGDMNDLSPIKSAIPGIINSVAYESGHRYGDFSTGDKLAAMTIGGLVAGKVLAKVGLFALVLKFWKVLLMAIAGGWGFLKRFFGRKKELALMPASDGSEPPAPSDEQA